MTKKKNFAVLILAVLMMLVVGLFTACNNTPEPPEGGSWITNSSNKIWTKTLTLKFEDEETFRVYSGSDVWITGNYKFEKNPGTSTLTLWNADVAIPNTEKNGEKTYEPNEEGVYYIEFDHGAGGTSKFNFQPPQDGTKPGTGAENPPTECTEHVDTNPADGKCDVCGEDMPNETPSEQVQLTMTATATSGYVTAYGKVECMTNNTWKLSIDYTGEGNYTETASGTWAMEGYTAIKLTVTADAANVLANDDYTVSIDATDQQNIKYASTIVCNIPQVGELTFNLSNVPPVSVQLEMTATATSGYVTAYGKIECMTDNTWKLSIDYTGEGNYTETASGTWAMNGYTGMTLTVVTDTADVIAEDTVAVAFDMTTTPGSIVYTAPVTCTIPQVGSLAFNFTATLAIPA